MELTRRDALAVSVGAGATGASRVTALASDGYGDRGERGPGSVARGEGDADLAPAAAGRSLRGVGVENPQGHPGGSDSYQRGPR